MTVCQQPTIDSRVVSIGFDVLIAGMLYFSSAFNCISTLSCCIISFRRICFAQAMIKPDGASLNWFNRADLHLSVLVQHVLDVGQHSWAKIKTKGTPPAPRTGQTAAFLPDGRVLVFGGCSMDSG